MFTPHQEKIVRELLRQQRELAGYHAHNLASVIDAEEFRETCPSPSIASLIEQKEKLSAFAGLAIKRGDYPFLETEKDREIFFEGMLNPPAPNERLKQAAERYNALEETNYLKWTPVSESLPPRTEFGGEPTNGSPCLLFTVMERGDEIICSGYYDFLKEAFVDYEGDVYEGVVHWGIPYAPNDYRLQE